MTHIVLDAVEAHANGAHANGARTNEHHANEDHANGKLHGRSLQDAAASASSGPQHKTPDVSRITHDQTVLPACGETCRDDQGGLRRRDDALEMAIRSGFRALNLLDLSSAMEMQNRPDRSVLEELLASARRDLEKRGSSGLAWSDFFASRHHLHGYIRGESTLARTVPDKVIRQVILNSLRQRATIPGMRNAVGLNGFGLFSRDSTLVDNEVNGSDLALQTPIPASVATIVDTRGVRPEHVRTDFWVGSAASTAGTSDLEEALLYWGFMKKRSAGIPVLREICIDVIGSIPCAGNLNLIDFSGIHAVNPMMRVYSGGFARRFPFDASDLTGKVLTYEGIASSMFGRVHREVLRTGEPLGLVLRDTLGGDLRLIMMPFRVSPSLAMPSAVLTASSFSGL